jgi:hypothetical protein
LSLRLRASDMTLRVLPVSMNDLTGMLFKWTFKSTN